MVRGRTRAFLAGPPLLKAATGEIATEEELGGAEMHTHVSGLGDYLAEDDRDALRIAREIMAKLEWDRPDADNGTFKPPRYDAEELLGIMPMDHKRPVDMRQAIARFVDNSDFTELWPCPHRGPCHRHHHQQRSAGRAGRQQGHAFHPGLLPDPYAVALHEQHHRLHGRPRL
jgi:hypothetical protein